MNTQTKIQCTKTPIQADNLKIIPNIKLIPEFIQFITWQSIPRSSREQKNQKEFAKAIGVSEDTLTDWKQHPQFWPLVNQNMNGWMRDRIPDVIGALYKRATTKGNAKDVETFLRLSGIKFDK